MRERSPRILIRTTGLPVVFIPERGRKRAVRRKVEDWDFLVRYALSLRRCGRVECRSGERRRDQVESYSH